MSYEKLIISRDDSVISVHFQKARKGLQKEYTVDVRKKRTVTKDVRQSTKGLNEAEG